jgi:hypothetical protein
VITTLLGGSPSAVPERYAQASPIRLLPLGVPQVLVIGEHEEYVPRPFVEAYAEAAGRVGDDVRVGDGLVPFLIDWGDGPHPARTAPGGLELVHLRAEHPDPVAIIEWLRRLGLELLVVAGRAPALIATLDTPRGRLELR